MPAAEFMMYLFAGLLTGILGLWIVIWIIEKLEKSGWL